MPVEEPGFPAPVKPRWDLGFSPDPEAETRESTAKTCLLDGNLSQQLEVAEHFAGTQHYATERVIGDGDRQSSFFADAFI
jgi:hypothetical protein